MKKFPITCKFPREFPDNQKFPFIPHNTAEFSKHSFHLIMIYILIFFFSLISQEIFSTNYKRFTINTFLIVSSHSVTASNAIFFSPSRNHLKINLFRAFAPACLMCKQGKTMIPCFPLFNRSCSTARPFFSSHNHSIHGDDDAKVNLIKILWSQIFGVSTVITPFNSSPSVSAFDIVYSARTHLVPTFHLLWLEKLCVFFFPLYIILDFH